MSLPPKRPHTEEQRSQETRAPEPHTYGLDPELTARLRGVGSRIRKSVTEGYSSSNPFSLNAPLPQTKLPFTKSQSFISASDALRDAYSMHSDTAVSAAPRSKRKDAVPDDGAGELSDVDLDVDLDVEMGGDFSTGGGRIPAVPRAGLSDVHSRPMIPLRPRATRSMPAGALQFSGGTSMQSGTVPPTMVEEEDWSSANFGGGGSFDAPCE